MKPEGRGAFRGNDMRVRPDSVFISSLLHTAALLYFIRLFVELLFSKSHFDRANR